MKATVVFFMLLFSHAAVVLCENYYEKINKPMADRLFEIALSANCPHNTIMNFPPSALSNKGPLKSPNSLHVQRTSFDKMETFDNFPLKSIRSYEYGPVGGFVLADPSDGSITVTFRNGWEDVYWRTHFPFSKRTKICDANMCEKKCWKCHSTFCKQCFLDHGFVQAWHLVREMVYTIIDDYTRQGFKGPIFLTGYALAGAIAMQSGMEMSGIDSYKHRLAATYTFGTPALIRDKECVSLITNSTMAFIRVRWRGDVLFSESRDTLKLDMLRHVVVDLWYTEPLSLKVCDECENFVPVIDKALNNAGKTAFNALCAGAQVPKWLFIVFARQCPTVFGRYISCPRLSQPLLPVSEGGAGGGHYIELPSNSSTHY